MVFDVILLHIPVKSMNVLHEILPTMKLVASDSLRDDGIVPDYDGSNVRVSEVGAPYMAGLKLYDMD